MARYFTPCEFCGYKPTSPVSSSKHHKEHIASGDEVRVNRYAGKYYYAPTEKGRGLIAQLERGTKPGSGDDAPKAAPVPATGPLYDIIRKFSDKRVPTEIIKEGVQFAEAIEAASGPESSSRTAETAQGNALTQESGSWQVMAALAQKARCYSVSPAIIASLGGI